MTISSRTPEGQPTFCPLCMANVVIDPSVFIGDATCPRCGQLLWFLQTAEAARLFVNDQSSIKKDRIIDFVAAQLGVERDKILNKPTSLDDLGADSLDTVELAMAIEDEFDLP